MSEWAKYGSVTLLLIMIQPQERASAALHMMTLQHQHQIQSSYQQILAKMETKVFAQAACKHLGTQRLDGTTVSLWKEQLWRETHTF